MTKKKESIYKTILSVTILSDEPIEDAGLEDISYQIMDGQWVGYNVTYKRKKLKGVSAIQAINDSGSSPEFFGMDSDGYPIEEE